MSAIRVEGAPEIIPCSDGRLTLQIPIRIGVAVGARKLHRRMVKPACHARIRGGKNFTRTGCTRREASAHDCAPLTVSLKKGVT